MGGQEQQTSIKDNFRYNRLFSVFSPSAYCFCLPPLLFCSLLLSDYSTRIDRNYQRRRETSLSYIISTGGMTRTNLSPVVTNVSPLKVRYVIYIYIYICTVDCTVIQARRIHFQLGLCLFIVWGFSTRVQSLRVIGAGVSIKVERFRPSDPVEILAISKAVGQKKVYK